MRSLKRIGRREFLALAAGNALALAATGKPNIVFFLGDDLGWADLGCYGSKFHETPQIDRLAASGMRFTDYYSACPVCSPTRASIMTGKYPGRLHLTNFLPGIHTLPHSKLIAPEFEQSLPAAEVTVAQALKSAGYATGCVGKWHLGTKGPRERGFDFEGRSMDGPAKESTTQRITTHALQFLDQAKDGAVLPLFRVSGPAHTAKDQRRISQALFRAGETRRAAAQSDLCRDDSRHGRCGRPRDGKVEGTRVLERTVVIFSSDNGGLTVPEWNCTVPTSNWPLRAGKGHLYEGGIRDPLIVSWPGVTRPNSVCREPVVSTDYFRTFTEIAELTNPPGNPVDGVSFVPLLKQSGKVKREAIFWHYPHYSNQGGKPSGAVRMGNFKLIEFYEDSRIELYDLKKDEAERHDLAARMPAKAAQPPRDAGGLAKSGECRHARSQSKIRQRASRAGDRLEMDGLRRRGGRDSPSMIMLKRYRAFAAAGNAGSRRGCSGRCQLERRA